MEPLLMKAVNSQLHETVAEEAPILQF
jgi:hypothetical protein